MSYPAVVQVLWLRPEDYPRFREIFDDVDDTFEEWRARMDRRLIEVREPGVEYERILVDPDALVAWCRANEREVNAEARALYPAIVALERDSRNEGS